MGAKIVWNRSFAAIAKDALGGNATAKYMASEARRLMDKYVPAETGMLADTVDTYVENGKGVVHYRNPYAHYQYEGRMMVAPNGSAWAKAGEIKQYNGAMLKHSKEKHQKATAHWDEAMMKERGDDLVRSVQAHIKRGGT